MFFSLFLFVLSTICPRFLFVLSTICPRFFHVVGKSVSEISSVCPGAIPSLESIARDGGMLFQRQPVQVSEDLVCALFCPQTHVFSNSDDQGRIVCHDRIHTHAEQFPHALLIIDCPHHYDGSASVHFPHKGRSDHLDE